MSATLALVAALAALNPARTRLGLPEDADGRARAQITVPGVVAGVAVLLGVAWVAPSLLGGLDISPETFRIAAGFVLMIVAAWMMFAPVPADEPVASGVWGAVWPVAYPRVISPETLTLAITAGASDGVPVFPFAVAGVVVLGLGSLPVSPLGRRVLGGVGRLSAVLLVVVATWLAVQGVREV